MEQIKIISSYDCLAVCGQNQHLLQAGNIYLLEGEQKILIYPTDSTRRPSFCIDASATQSNQFFDVVMVGEQKIFCLSCQPLCQSLSVHTLELPNGQCVLTIGENDLTIKFLQHKKILPLQESFSTYKVGVEGGFVYVLLTGRRSQTLYLFEPNTGKVKMLCGEEVKLSGGRVTVSKNLQNIARQAVTEHYFLSGGQISKEDTQISYQNGRPVLVMSQQVVPLAFLQALQVGDAEVAADYLDLPMRRRVDDQHLLEFFGEIRFFAPLEPDTFVVIGSAQQGIFKFAMQDNRISEIFAVE